MQRMQIVGALLGAALAHGPAPAEGDGRRVDLGVTTDARAAASRSEPVAGPESELASAELGSEASSEAELGSEAEPEAESELGSEAEPETEAELGSEASSEAELGSEAETSAEAELGSEAEAEAEVGPEAEAESEAESEVGSEAEAEAEAGSEPASEAGLVGPVVRLEVRGPMAVRLHRLGPGPKGEVDGSIRGVPFSTVCDSPCDQAVDARGQVFLVAAPELMPSPEFTLDDYEGRVTVDVTPGRRSVRFAGFGVTVAGAILVPLGILVLSTASDRPGGVAGGATVIGAGAASLATGIALLLAGRTRVSIEGRRRERGPLEGPRVVY
jgi:hypothetical protein